MSGLICGDRGPSGPARSALHPRRMIAIGQQAPDFTLEDQFGQKFHLADQRGRHNVLLLFYPLDWTPT